MNKIINIALLQILPCSTLEENRIKGIEYCRRAKALGADIALFPEMWSNGYNISWDVGKNCLGAVDCDSDFVISYSELAKELDMAVAITFMERYEPLPRNTVCLFDRLGNCALKYAKVHTCVFDVERNLTPGDDFFVSELDIGGDKVRVGAMICYDREFPESARILMLKGAELILVPNACPMEVNRLSQLRARAFENMLGIATANYPYGKPDCNGHSSAFDGIAYRSAEPCSRDTLIVEAGENEGIYIAPFPIEEMREYRMREIHGDRYRRPDRYRILCDR